MLAVALIAFVLSRSRMVATYTQEICEALADATCNTDCTFDPPDGCSCNASLWQCEVHFETHVTYDGYITGTGYVDCFRNSRLDCSINVMDAYYYYPGGTFSPGECNSRTCKDKGIATAVIIGISVGCGVVLISGIAFAYYWFRVRKHDVVMRRLSDSLKDVDNPPECINQQV
jgi:hypothetical protein